MKNDKSDEAPVTTTEEPAAEEKKPRKIMLGKRVLRHFSVKTGVHTGLATESCIGDTGLSRGHIRVA